MTSQAVQLPFTLRTSANVRSVHLVGSWDSYKGHLPLSVDSNGKPGSWKGVFRFQGSQGLKPGTRYWYYYIIDSYHVTHDPAKEFTTEKTTGRKLNILNVPAARKAANLTVVTANLTSTKQPTQVDSSADQIASGRSLSPSRIQHPKPTKAYASRQLREADYELSPIDDLEDSVAKLSLNEHLARNRVVRPPSELSNGSSVSGGPTFSDCSSDSSSESSTDSETESEDESQREYHARIKELARRGHSARTARLTSSPTVRSSRV